ncbi:major capsid protein [Capybara microvirus Cap3_SP_433]|nr:major capsid protein [Capybara microvirus Cap3_SP_433]
MNKETQSRFSEIPIVEKQRSKFKRPYSHKTTINAADIVPIYIDEVLPGDTVSMDMGAIVRMTTPLYPVMDNAYIDYMFFFVPNRLTWEHWQAFWGENEDPWTQDIEYEVPQLNAPTGGWEKGTIADYFGIPTKIENISVNALPFRAYCKIWNDWFRDENLKTCVHINTDETTQTGANDGDEVIVAQLGAKPLKAAKYHDYFTSALPSAQKGSPVFLPLGEKAPVIAGEKHEFARGIGLNFQFYNEQQMSEGYHKAWLNARSNGDITINGETATTTGYAQNFSLQPTNLWTDLTEATASTINQLRTAFAIQRFYEAQARSGSRYIEFIKSIFGVTSPDARLQRSEYLGGKRVPINMDQVLQTSATDSNSPQGNTAAYSCTINADSMFTHSFTEHGILIGIAVIRTNHTYQQGIPRMFSRKKWTDYYIPQFAHLSEQAILNKEIYATGTEADNEAFGYQEAWADYRYKNSQVTGAMRSNYEGSLDVWHYADYYTEQPILGSEWIDETPVNIDRTLAVTSALEHQFICDFYFKPIWTRVMPMYSVPGLIDHY